MILPGAVATISTVPNDAQASATQNRAITVAPIARPIGEGGVSTISSAAGRKASSCSVRRTISFFGNGIIFLVSGSHLALFDNNFSMLGSRYKAN